ncbi:hypothetical protein AX15_004954 [Amanita polypyramis BW_CC]|nr:hypothetical protein AX15_004954 [Amanita polypyramis BW_CC]
MAIYAQQNYSGQSAFSSLPSSPSANTSIPLTALSLALSSDVWAAVTLGLNNERVILWDSVPDVTQLSSSSSVVLLDLQSSACTPACSSSAVCSPQGVCLCPPGFTGSSCEQCASGFFGSNCARCSGQGTGCDECDGGLSGTGICFQRTNSTQSPVSECNCVNGICGSTGQCACIPGWATGDNGQSCSKCAGGFFSTGAGECKVCQPGCAQCADTTGTCVACKSGYTQDANDPTKCNPVRATISSTTTCPDGSFSNGAQCGPCSLSCQTCTGPSSNECATCANGKYIFNGNCVDADGNGVCEGANGMIADNNKKECDTCGPHCTSCEIPNFTIASTVNQAQCTGCLPGYLLSKGQCVQSCPEGTFVSPQDNATCIPCNSECTTCANSADFCLSCPSNGLAFNGKCVTECPSNTILSNSSNDTRACVTCHPDCAACSGPSFTQCTNCPVTRPILSNGRCLSTCNRGQFFDLTSKSCQQCDSTCATCSGSADNQCLSCNSERVLRAGTCVPSACNGEVGVIDGLGICFSDLVRLPASTTTNGTAIPLPTISGLTQPVTKKEKLAWWQVLLMAFGCAFIFLVIVLLWRKGARRKRSQKTAIFVRAKGMDGKWWWQRSRLARLFGGTQQRSAVHDEDEGVGLKLRLRDMEEIGDIEKMEDRRWSRQSTISKLSSIHDEDIRRRRDIGKSASGIYSEIMGVGRQGPEPRQPVKEESSAR